jgi:hypothetical protein
MQESLRPYVTAGIAIVGASLIAVTPVTPPPPNMQQRALRLVDYTEYDASQLTTTTEANWSGLESVLSSSNWTTDHVAVVAAPVVRRLGMGDRRRPLDGSEHPGGAG